jgi:hypothetical protein
MANNPMANQNASKMPPSWREIDETACAVVNHSYGLGDHRGPTDNLLDGGRRVRGMLQNGAAPGRRTAQKGSSRLGYDRASPRRSHGGLAGRPSRCLPPRPTVTLVSHLRVAQFRDEVVRIQEIVRVRLPQRAKLIDGLTASLATILLACRTRSGNDRSNGCCSSSRAGGTKTRTHRHGGFTEEPRGFKCLALLRYCSYRCPW